ncbi:hypothetical protein [Aquabacterium sp. NJ1]|uniref:hypothetical protein n=1 Tax=Aquabacterium sp. NJ1 TaxID=1538295 RepID=UPI001F3A6B39|nr:hypothetical protein [Aquabacterium sp. NJ1]
MHTLGFSIVTIGLVAVFATIGWHVYGGLRLKRQVDRDFQLMRAFNRAREARILSSISR